MRTSEESYPDLPPDLSHPATARVVRDLETLFTLPAPAATRDAITQAIYEHQARAQRWRPRIGAPLLLRLGSLVAAAVVVLTAVLVVQRHTPTPVSAQIVLERAAAVRLPPNRALHLVYRGILPGQPGSDTTDIWEITNRRGIVVRSATSMVTRTSGTITSITRAVETSAFTRGYYYLPLSHVVQRFTVTPAQQASISRYSVPSRPYDGPGLARYLEQMLKRSPQAVHLLPDQRLGGVAVYPVHVDQGLFQHRQNQPAFTVYFDARSYLVRSVTSPPHQFVGTLVENTRLVRDDVLPRSAVPVGTFNLTLPSGVVVLP